MERRAPIAGRVADLHPVRRVGEHGQRHSDDHGVSAGSTACTAVGSAQWASTGVTT